MSSKTKADIAADIRALADLCFDMAVEASYYGGFDPLMMHVERELLTDTLRMTELANSMEVAQ